VCKQQNVFDSNFNGRCPSKEGQLQLYKFVNYKKTYPKTKYIQKQNISKNKPQHYQADLHVYEIRN